MGGDDQLSHRLHLPVLTQRPAADGQRECGEAARDDLPQGYGELQ